MKTVIISILGIVIVLAAMVLISKDRSYKKRDSNKSFNRTIYNCIFISKVSIRKICSIKSF